MLENLRRLRNEKNISQRALGEAVGVKQQTINKYENHNIEPDIATLKKLAGYFGTTIDYITGYSDIESDSLDEREKRLLEDFRKVNEARKQSIELVLKNYLE